MQNKHDAQDALPMARCAVCGCEVFDDGAFFGDGRRVIHDDLCACEFLERQGLAALMEQFGFQAGMRPA